MSEIVIFFDDGKEHQSVYVAGDFTRWSEAQLAKEKGTRYSAKFEGLIGDVQYNYKFLVDDKWVLGPNLPVSTDKNGNQVHTITASHDNPDFKPKDWPEATRIE